uniref:Uncharacterized protein n=1 Tax=Oncorhynchus kisutch TaxID=8019 RepID=A0A8C7FEC0_ONCKI
MVASFTPLQPTLGIAHGDLRFVCGCSAMETHYMKLLMNSSCVDVASRGSLERGSECCNRGQMIFTSYALQDFISSVFLSGCKPEQQMMYVFEIRNTEDLTEEWLREELGFFG